MGKVLRFFKSLLGFKTTDSPPSFSETNKQLRRRWSFGKSRREICCSVRLGNHTKSIDGTSLHPCKNEEPNKKAIALVAATAAVVDAAVAAAQAAVEVVRMTGKTIGYGVRDELAAIKIQSCFRAYLARRALRALKALVKLQAVVRGHIIRKQTTDMMRRLQVLIRAQTRARALRFRINGSTTKPSHFNPIMNDSKYYVRGITDQERTCLDGLNNRENEKIVVAESHGMTKGRKLFKPDQISFLHSQSLTTSRGSTLQPTSSSPCASSEVNSFYYSTRGGVSTLVKSDGPRSCISDHPNYMANTESSRAKARSLSAPRLRPQLHEDSNAIRKDSGYKYVMGMKRGPTTHDGLDKKIYTGSCRLRLPVYDTEYSEYCDGYWN